MSRFLKRLSKILVITFVALYCLIWLLSPTIIRYVINNHGLPTPLSLTSASSIRYNPFTAHLTISHLEMKTNQQDSVLKLQRLDAELHLHQLLFDKIYVSEFSVKGIYIPVTVDESSLNVAGFELMAEESTSITEEQEVNASESNDSFAYEIIIPKFKMTDLNIELTHLAQQHHILVHSFSLDDISFSKLQQKIQLQLKSEFNGAAIEVALNAQLLQQQGQVIVDLNAEDITLSSAKAVLPQQISALDGQVSFASKINIDIAKEQTSVNINDLLLSIKNLHIEQNNIVLNIDNQQVKAKDVAVLLSPIDPVSVKASLDYDIEGISAKSVVSDALLADISALSVNNMALVFEKNQPKINVDSVNITNSQFSKNNVQDMPALAAFNQLLVNHIEYTPELITVNDIALSGLVAHVLLDAEKNLATLVAFAKHEQESSKNIVQESDNIEKSPVEPEQVPKAIEPATTLAYRLGKFTLLDDARIDFKDSSVTPHYERNFIINSLSVTDVDSRKPEQESLFAMQGKSDKYANFDIKGRGLAFAPQQKFTVDAVIKELSLPSVSSYIKGALKYEIESGQLDTTISASLTGTALDGNIDLLLRGVEFTAADDHETGTINDQTSMPFNVALGMLKDSTGNVELSLPLSGDTSAPSFGFSGLLTLLVKQATMSAAKEYLITTFVPYASVMKVAMAAGEFVLKLRINDLNYLPEQVELNPEQIEFSRQMSVMLADKEGVNVKLCAVAIASDINLTDATQAHQAENIARLKAISQQRVEIFKAHMVEQLNVSSARLLLCTPQIDTSKGAKARIKFVI